MNTTTPAGLRDRTMLEVLYSSGLWATELLKMDVSEVDFKEGVVLIHGKGWKERILPIGTTALRMLESYIRAGADLLTSAAHHSVHVQLSAALEFSQPIESGG